MSSVSRFKSGERFGAIPVEVMESDAWGWLPQFARLALLGLAAGYSGNNNGGIDFTDSRARELHMNKTDKNLGLRLACHAGIIKKTVKERRRSGRGIPAKYALTWKPLDHFECFNFCATTKASNDWMTATIPDMPIKSRRAAQKFFGWKVTSSPWPPPDQNIEGEHHVESEKPALRAPRTTRKSSVQPTRVVHCDPHVRPDESDLL
jgi:hypothetical protein